MVLMIWRELCILLPRAGITPLSHLLNAGVTVSDAVLQSAVTTAAMDGYHLVVSLLLNAGAAFQSHPFNIAVRRGYHQVVSLLVDAGADVHIFDDEPRCERRLRWATS